MKLQNTLRWCAFAATFGALLSAAASSQAQDKKFGFYAGYAYLHTDILFDSVPSEHARALAAITQLWRTLEKPDRAEQTLNKLATTYPRSPWLKKAQGTP